MSRRIARFWLLLSSAGSALYVALYAAFYGFGGISITGIGAVVLGALAIAILLALDEQQPQSDEKIESMTVAGLAYLQGPAAEQ